MQLTYKDIEAFKYTLSLPWRTKYIPTDREFLQAMVDEVERCWDYMETKSLDDVSKSAKLADVRSHLALVTNELDRIK